MILNEDQYIDDFSGVVLLEYKAKAEELLYNAIETCDPGESLEVSVEGDLCKDRMDHFFRFSTQPDFENVGATGGVLVRYEGYN